MNRERKARLQAEQFGAQAALCRMLPCCVCGAPPPSDPEHVRTRGAGGKDKDTAPMCRRCHQLRHDHGHAGPFLIGLLATSTIHLPSYAERVPCSWSVTARAYFEHVAVGLAAVLKLTAPTVRLNVGWRPIEVMKLKVPGCEDCK